VQFLDAEYLALEARAGEIGHAMREFLIPKLLS
jgi:hypothetical protein